MTEQFCGLEYLNTTTTPSVTKWLFIPNIFLYFYFYNDCRHHNIKKSSCFKSDFSKN